MLIGGLQKITLIDYPGKVAATVFLTGCNFRCPFCYSSELVLPEKIKKQPKISQKEFFNFLAKRKTLIEGVVVCGGEPTISKQLPSFIKKIKKAGFLVKLDTNGSDSGLLKKLISQQLLDYVAMDIKAPLKMQNAKCKNQFAEAFVSSHASAKASANDNVKFKKNKYKEATGGRADLNKIKKSIEIIKNSGVDYEFRTTVVPGIHKREDIIQIAKDIAPAKRYYLQSFRPEKNIDPKFEKVKPYPQEFLLEIQKTISPFFETCQLR